MLAMHALCRPGLTCIAFVMCGELGIHVSCFRLIVKMYCIPFLIFVNLSVLFVVQSEGDYFGVSLFETEYVSRGNKINQNSTLTKKYIKKYTQLGKEAREWRG